MCVAEQSSLAMVSRGPVLTPSQRWLGPGRGGGGGGWRGPVRRTLEGGGGMGRPNVCRLPGQRRVPANFVTISQSSIMMGRVKQEWFLICQVDWCEAIEILLNIYQFFVCNRNQVVWKLTSFRWVGLNVSIDNRFIVNSLYCATVILQSGSSGYNNGHSTVNT